MSYAYHSLTGTLIAKPLALPPSAILDAFDEAYLRAKRAGATEDLAKKLGDDAAQFVARLAKAPRVVVEVLR